MLCRHVVFRQSVSRALSRLLSTTAAGAPKPRGRPRKTPITIADESTGQREEDAANAAPGELLIKRGPGRPRKAIKVVDVPSTGSGKPPRKDGQSSKETATTIVSKNDRAKRVAAKTSPAKRTKSLKQRPLPLRPNHHDLKSFLEYAGRAELNKDTSVYRGTLYEYVVAEALQQRYNFSLRRMGRSNDLGIDLIGAWTLPEEPCELRVLIQCKASKPRPSYVRELEGAYAGAPPGWKGADVMLMLITRDPATPGVIAGLYRSRAPLGFAQITEEGEVLQFIWNKVAQESRLTGMSVTNMYKAPAGDLIPPAHDRNGRLTGAISLNWMGARCSGLHTSLQGMHGPQSESRVSG
ncbi:uncharacterized protein RCC_05774 [Ramularia collo-cygni]|uniref:Required for respiratory growth protein 7, mitochondrial n=1 Tax=Ramularia collo-cygni TaxID=112498 RepID=A0A2D3V5D2_9PEZI|nr:uncharacterized protein RCC_05774 [Ramularia collo-cygni]CZT19917.1 uncharacterized protein RCC_05774 [Ramularia collo-cygni]